MTAESLFAKDSTKSAKGRVDAVDFGRGCALVGMALYHLSWDLADFRLVSPMLPFTPPMRLLSHVVASAFLALVGVSLALAHRDGLQATAFLRRLGVIAAAAALVTAASFVFAPGEPIGFGILHCIVAASVLATPFVTAPAWTSLLVGVIAISIPFFVHSQAFDPPALLWFGLGEALPNTLDWRPLLPWGGVVFLGLGVARIPGVMSALTAPDRWRATSTTARTIAFAGRHSLPIYLIHQPILIGLVAAIAYLGVFAHAAAPQADDRAFLAECNRVCVAKGRAAQDCASSCQCVADAIQRSGEAARLAAGPLDDAASDKLKRMANACMEQ